MKKEEILINQNLKQKERIKRIAISLNIYWVIVALISFFSGGFGETLLEVMVSIILYSLLFIGLTTGTIFYPRLFSIPLLLLILFENFYPPIEFKLGMLWDVTTAILAFVLVFSAYSLKIIDIKNDKREFSKEDDYQYENESSNEKKSEPCNQSFNILGLSKSASVEEIKHSYKELIKKYHPDKFSHLDSDFVKIAEIRAKEINQAYEMLRKKFGF